MTTANTKVIVVIGKTGNGKSSTANTFLGKEEFLIDDSLSSTTKIVSQASITAFQVDWKVFDLPGLKDTDNDTDDSFTLNKFDTFHQLLRQIKSTGVHAFFFVFNVTNKFQAEEKEVVRYYRDLLGDEFKKYCILVFTFGDVFDWENNATFVDWLTKQEKKDDEFKILYNECQKRACLIINKGKHDSPRRESKNTLISAIENLLTTNNQSSYTFAMYDIHEKGTIRSLFDTRITEIRERQDNLKSKIFKPKREIRRIYSDIAIIKSRLQSWEVNDRKGVIQSLIDTCNNEEDRALSNFNSLCIIL